MTGQTFQPIPARTAPVNTEGLVAWIRSNLFGNWSTSLGTLTIVATMLLGSLLFKASGAMAESAVLYPLVLGGFSIIASIVGSMFVKTSPGGKIMNALYRGLIVAGMMALVAFYPLTAWIVDDHLLDQIMGISGGSQMRLYGAAVIGLVLTGLMVLITEYYTATV